MVCRLLCELVALPSAHPKSSGYGFLHKKKISDKISANSKSVRQPISFYSCFLTAMNAVKDENLVID